MSTRVTRIIVLAIFILILLVEPANAQCSMCRAVLLSEEGQQTAKGINNGIVYLMAIPYILVALVGWRVFKIYKS
jgi:hypothetical protein|tara:strand:- start:33393 stop:33617 length:225 start_codon:yes stop_codon:yes gene_type:complete